MQDRKSVCCVPLRFATGLVTIKYNWRAPWKNQICSTTMKQKITHKASDAAENLQL